MEVKNKDNNAEVFNEFGKRTGLLGVSVFGLDFARNQISGRAYKRSQYLDMKMFGELDMFCHERLYYDVLRYNNDMSEEEMQLFYAELLNHAFTHSKDPVSMEVYSRYERCDIFIKSFNYQISVGGCNRDRLLSLLRITREAVTKNQVKLRELNRMDDDIFSVLKYKTGPFGVTNFSLDFYKEGVVAKGYKPLQAINVALTKDEGQYYYCIPEYKISLSPSEMFIFFDETFNKIIHDTKLPVLPKLYTDQGKGQVIVKSGMHTINAVSSNIEDLLMIMMRTHRVANRNGLEVKEHVLTPRRSK